MKYYRLLAAILPPMSLSEWLSICISKYMQDTHAPLAWVGRRVLLVVKAINAYMACILGCYCATTKLYTW